MGESGARPGHTRPSRPADLARRHAEYAEYLHSGPRRYSGHAHAIVFSGTGGEYFRLWLADLLRTLFSLGVYYPWAEVRRLRYFRERTEVAGHALEFHGAPRKALGAGVLAAVLATVAAAVWLLPGGTRPEGEAAPLSAGWAALALLLAAAWPAFWQASLRFRVGQTGWRGLRFEFTGAQGPAYAASAVLLAAVGLMAAGVLIAWRSPPDWSGAGFGAAASVLIALLVLPQGWLRMKRYRQGHCACAHLQTELRALPWAVYAVCARVAGLAVLSWLVVGAVLVGLAALLGGDASALGQAPAALVALPLLLVLIVPRAYATAHLQNLLWSRTGSSRLRFRSELRAAPVAALMARNALLLLLTLGLYWPWAAVAMARLRLEAVSLHTRAPLDELQGEARAALAEREEAVVTPASIALTRLRQDSALSSVGSADTVHDGADLRVAVPALHG